MRTSRGALRKVALNTVTTHGKVPASSKGMKYHHGSSRLWIFVVKRRKCSCTKKNHGNSGLRMDTNTNQGATMARNSKLPDAMCRRVHRRQSRSSRVYNTIEIPGRT